MNPDVPASVRARLLALAKRTQEDFQLYIVRYAAERFLYRLGRSTHRERCTLKGAALFTLWMRDPYRPTRDVDLLASGASDEAAVRELMGGICAVECPENGLVYDLESLHVAPIRAVEEYSGQRARLTALLGKTHDRVEDPGVVRVVQHRELVREPGDREALAAAPVDLLGSRPPTS